MSEESASAAPPAQSESTASHENASGEHPSHGAAPSGASTGQSQSSNGAQAAGEEVAEAVARAEEAGESIDLSQTIKYTIDGEEVEKPIQWFLDAAGLKKVSTKRLEDASAMRKEAARLKEEAAKKEQRINGLFGTLRENPDMLEDALREVGVDIDDWFYRRAEKIVAEADMSPEERARVELERERAALEEEKARIETEKRTKEEERYYQRALESTKREIVDAAREAGLPEDPRVVAMFAERMSNSAAGLSAADFADEVAEEYAHLRKSALESIGGVKELVELLGPERMNEIRKYDLEQVAGKQKEPPRREQPLSRRDRPRKKRVVGASRAAKERALGRLK